MPSNLAPGPRRHGAGHSPTAMLTVEAALPRRRKACSMLGLPTPGPRRTRARRRATIGVALLGAVCAALMAVPAAASAPAAAATKAPPVAAVDLGSRVVVFDPSMPVAEIQARADAIHAQQVDAEMGSERWSLLFLPGHLRHRDRAAADPGRLLHRGGRPRRLAVRHRRSTARSRSTTAASPTDRASPYCVALNNFWRSMSNLTIAGQRRRPGRLPRHRPTSGPSPRPRRCAASTSAAATCRSWTTAPPGPQFASGGYLADSRTGDVVNGSQQQWITRNAEVGSWSNGVWNQVFAGTVGAPAETGLPDPPYTTLDTTPVSREKPFLYVDAAGHLAGAGARRRAPTRAAPTGPTGPGTGREPDGLARDFYVARPGDSARELASQLARGKHLLLTPGVYDIDRSLGRAPRRHRRPRPGPGHAHRGRAEPSRSWSTTTPGRRRRRGDHRRRHRVVAGPDAHRGQGAARPTVPRNAARPARPARPSTTSTSASAAARRARPTSRSRSTPTTC